MCAGRRAPGFCFDGYLSGWTHAAVQRGRERVAEVRRWLANYQELKEAIEAICELNHDLLRSEAASSKGGRRKRD
jgi:hypothetical protein